MDAHAKAKQHSVRGGQVLGDDLGASRDWEGGALGEERDFR